MADSNFPEEPQNGPPSLPPEFHLISLLAPTCTYFRQISLRFLSPRTATSESISLHQLPLGSIRLHPTPPPRIQHSTPSTPHPETPGQLHLSTLNYSYLHLAPNRTPASSRHPPKERELSGPIGTPSTLSRSLHPRLVRLPIRRAHVPPRRLHEPLPQVPFGHLRLYPERLRQDTEWPQLPRQPIT